MLTGFALDSLQQLESDRAAVVLACVSKVQAAHGRAYDEIQLTYQHITTAITDKTDDVAGGTTSSAITSEGPGSESNKPRPIKNNLMKQLLKTNSLDAGDGTGSGVMDCETLGLPAELGELRDDVRSSLRKRQERVAVVRSLAALLEAVAAAEARFGVGLQQALEKYGYNGSAAAAGDAAIIGEDFESPDITRARKALLATLERESKQALAVASSLRTLRTDRCDKVILYGDHTRGKPVSEIDDNYWKYLCDAARAQSRAEMRYRQTTAHTARVRERVKSAGSAKDVASGAGDASGSTTSTESPKPKHKVNKHVMNVSKMLSILPDGGEQAMKIFAPGVNRASIAKQSLEEADSKESKNRHLLDAAVEASSRALEHYKSHATALVTKYQQEEKSGWEDVRITVDSFVSQLESLKAAMSATRQHQEFAKASTTSADPGFAYLEEWKSRAQQEILAKKSEIEEACDDDDFLVPPSVGHEEPQRSISDRLLSESSMRSSMDEDDDNDSEGSSAGAADLEDDEIDEEYQGRGYDGRPSTPTKSNSADDQDEAASCNGSERGGVDDESHSSGHWIRSISGGSTSPLGISKNDKTLRKKLSFGLGTTKSTDSGTVTDMAGCDTAGLSSGTKKRSGQLDMLTEVFLTYFWPDPIDRSTVPQVLDSFACSFRDKSHKLPFQYGRVFVTSGRIIFNSWTGKKLNLRWSDVLDLELTSSFMNSADDTIMVTSRKSSTEEAYVLLGGFIDREQAMDVFKKLRGAVEEETAAQPTSRATTVDKSIVPSIGDQVPPDNTLRKMDKVLNRHLRGISIERFYEIAWSEGNGTNEKPLYGPWLGKHCFDVDVGDWEIKPVVGPWCGETYQQKRTITFRVKRKTHLYIGPPIANVKQTHYCRVEGNDKCVLGMTVEFDGIPYSDTFAVEVRWVARRQGSDDILIEVGVFVDFKKNTFLKAKIRAGTIEESKFCSPTKIGLAV